MKQVLIIKTSSLGDVVHTLPALTDAARALPGIQFDWVVEDGIAEIPAWHPSVREVLPVALRRWRRGWWSAQARSERQAFRARLQSRSYDAVIDAQGLLKSAAIGWFAKGPRHGFHWDSAREPVATLLYRHRHSVPRSLHAIERLRRLFADVLGYPCPGHAPVYGLDPGRFHTPAEPPGPAPYLVFLHGTTWPTKHWPEVHWIQLGQMAAAAGRQILLPWGNEAERERAHRIADAAPGCTVLPRLRLSELARLLAHAQAVVAVDTGLAHVTAALGTPAITLYGPTEPGLTGTVGSNQLQMRVRFPCAPCLRRMCTFNGPRPVEPPCFATLDPATVWGSITTLAR